MSPPKLVIACPNECGLHPDKIGPGAAAALLAIRENGAGVNVFKRRGEEILGHPLAATSVTRHLKHYREANPTPDEPETGEKVGDLAILDSIIAAGYRNSKNWKPTIRDTLEAMKLKASLTGNSVFDDMLAAMNEALDSEEEAPEAPEAVFAPDERPVEEDLPEPVL